MRRRAKILYSHMSISYPTILIIIIAYEQRTISVSVADYIIEIVSDFHGRYLRDISHIKISPDNHISSAFGATKDNKGQAFKNNRNVHCTMYIMGKDRLGLFIIAGNGKSSETFR